MPQVQKLAILDDYQGVTLSHPAWAKLPHLQPAAFQDTITDLDALATRLAPFDAILAMRERTPFNAALINRLPNLRLLMTTGERNRGFDVAAVQLEFGASYRAAPVRGDVAEVVADAITAHAVTFLGCRRVGAE